MLVCEKAFLKGDKRPKKIYCNITGGECDHVRFCSVSMKYYQPDDAIKCEKRKKK